MPERINLNISKEDYYAIMDALSDKRKFLHDKDQRRKHDLRVNRLINQKHRQYMAAIRKKMAKQAA
jgi:hypothetical protein